MDMKNILYDKRTKAYLEFAQRICKEKEISQTKKTLLFYRYVKRFTDKILMQNSDNTLVDGYSKKSGIAELISPKAEVLNYLRKFSLNTEIKVNLSDVPFICYPHNITKMYNNIISDITDKENWLQQNTSQGHYFTLYLPIGVIFVSGNGNHSSFGGYFKDSACVCISDDNVNTEVMDMSGCYEHYYFDGKYYRNKENNKKEAKANDLNFGIVYELGRIAMIYHLSYTSVFNNTERK